MQEWNSQLLAAFQNAAESMKLYRRADLTDPEHGDPLIDKLYVDPLAQDSVLRTAFRPNTTFVVGRKGTGKSTIFQRLQSEIRRTKNRTSAYVDIKTVYESSQVDPAVLHRVSAVPNALPPESLARLLLYKEFLRAVIEEIKSELRKRIDGSIWERMKDSVTGTSAELFEGLDAVLEEANEKRFVDALAYRADTVKANAAIEESQSQQDKLSLGLGSDPNLQLETGSSESRSRSGAIERQYTEVLVRSFDIKEFVLQLKALLENIGIRHLYVLIDDFSELPQDAMHVVVDVLLAPLNNWSDEFVKFKVASYPGRIYYGEIDKNKIDEIYLDPFHLYGGGDVGRMEESAIDFTRRLVDGRVQHFCRVPAESFFESSESDVWQELFYASMANPRILGNLLQFLHDSHLIAGRRIGIRAIREAGQKYYEEKIEPYFRMGKFLHVDFRERSSIYSLKELLESVVSRARELRQHDSEVIRMIRGRPFTSHFHLLTQYEALFSTLELNFFVSKYFEMSDRSARKVTVFALNYGLCAKHEVRFGRPVGEREFRLYFVERFFDYSPLILSYIKKNQEISCETCNERFGYEKLDAIRMFDMLCPSCRKGRVSVTNLSQKYAAELEAVDQALLLPPAELGILQTLHAEQKAMRAGAIAAELDCSYQLVGKRGKALVDRGFVRRFSNAQGNRVFEIDPVAESAYFGEGPSAALEVRDDPENVGGQRETE